MLFYACLNLKIRTRNYLSFSVCDLMLIVSKRFQLGAVKDTLGLQLVGPFDILAGANRNTKNPQPNFHLHWRYFYDPPEFQTVLKGSEDTQHHMGYYRYTVALIKSRSFVEINLFAKVRPMSRISCNYFNCSTVKTSEIAQTLCLRLLGKIMPRRAAT